MKLSICSNYEEMSNQAADEIISQVRRKPASVLCLASGDTPRLTCRLTAEKAAREAVDFSQCTFIGLDEWVGIPPGNEGSCQFFLRHELFGPLGISDHQIHLFDALSADLAGECRKMDGIIFKTGGIDLMIVGIGMNGHIGFNEPGQAFEQDAHVSVLDDATRTVGQKYFREQTTLLQGITLGFNHLLQARKVILIANGEKKAAVVKKALEEQVSTQLPASVIRKHANALVILDRSAASGLSQKGTGHEAPATSHT